MSAKPAVLDPMLAPFIAAGLRVSVVGSYLLLHDVPVVDDQQQLRLGTLTAMLVYTDGQVTPPATHQVWFDGPFPCFANGAPLEQLRHSEVVGGVVAPEVPARFFFSNKNEGWSYCRKWCTGWRRKCEKAVAVLAENVACRGHNQRTR